MIITLYKKERSTSRTRRWKWQPYPLDFLPEWYFFPNFNAFVHYLLGVGEYRVGTSVRKGKKAVWKTLVRFRCEGARRFVKHEDKWNTLLAV